MLFILLLALLLKPLFVIQVFFEDFVHTLVDLVEVCRSLMQVLMLFVDYLGRPLLYVLQNGLPANFVLMLQLPEEAVLVFVGLHCDLYIVTPT